MSTVSGDWYGSGIKMLCIRNDCHTGRYLNVLKSWSQCHLIAFSAMPNAKFLQTWSLWAMQCQWFKGYEQTNIDSFDIDAVRTNRLMRSNVCESMILLTKLYSWFHWFVWYCVLNTATSIGSTDKKWHVFQFQSSIGTCNHVLDCKQIFWKIIIELWTLIDHNIFEMHATQLMVSTRLW